MKTFKPEGERNFIVTEMLSKLTLLTVTLFFFYCYCWAALWRITTTNRTTSQQTSRKNAVNEPMNVWPDDKLTCYI